jgi:CheY-like chemotaxis protein
MTSRPVTILLVDDDVVDVKIVKRSFLDLKISNPVIVARDGIEALERLRGENGYEKVPTPHLILLDLHMPRMGGFEFLDELRIDPALRRTLVFVMTTSAAEQDRTRAYDKNVVGYVLKERAGSDFIASAGAMRQYWQMIEFPD